MCVRVAIFLFLCSEVFHDELLRLLVRVYTCLLQLVCLCVPLLPLAASRTPSTAPDAPCAGDGMCTSLALGSGTSCVCCMPRSSLCGANAATNVPPGTPLTDFKLVSSTWNDWTCAYCLHMRGIDFGATPTSQHQKNEEHCLLLSICSGAPLHQGLHQKRASQSRSADLHGIMCVSFKAHGMPEHRSRRAAG